MYGFINLGMHISASVCMQSFRLHSFMDLTPAYICWSNQEYKNKHD